jgi:O-antigen ligase
MISLSYVSIISLYSQWPLSSLLGVLRIVEIVIVGWLISRFIARKNLSIHIPIILSISLIGVSCLTAWQFFTQHSIGGLWYFLGERSFSMVTPGIANANLSGTLVLRPYATFPHPNVLAAFCVLLICFLLYFPARLTHRLLRLLLTTAVLLGSISTILSMSRTAISVLALVMSVWLLRFVTRSAKNNLLILLWGIGGFGVLVVSGTLTRFSSLRITDEAVVLREFLSTQALQMFNSNFWTGVGVSNFLPTLSLELDPLLPYRNFQPVHSLYLLILSETGVIGAVLCIVGITFLLAKVWKSRVHRLGRSMLLLCVLLLGATDHYFYTLHQGQLLLGFVLGVLLADFPPSYFTDSKAKNRGKLIQRSSSKKTMPSISLKISRTRVSSRKKR